MSRLSLPIGPLVYSSEMPRPVQHRTGGDLVRRLRPLVRIGGPSARILVPGGSSPGISFALHVFDWVSGEHGLILAIELDAGEPHRHRRSEPAESLDKLEEIDLMSTTYNVAHYPDDMVRASRSGSALEENWAETTVRSVVESVEDYARQKPLVFAAWALGIGFVLGWKLKPW